MLHECWPGLLLPVSPPHCATLPGVFIFWPELLQEQKEIGLALCYLPFGFVLCVFLFLSF